MRFQVLPLILLSLLFSTMAKADEGSDSLVAKRVDYQFLTSQHQNFFSEIPSVLSEWQYANWSYLGLKYDFQEGNFRNLQKYSKLQLLNVSTESILKLPKTKWTLHGKFSYSNGQADSVGSNLSYHIGRYGSPNYLLQLKRGNWSLQNYHFEAAGSNQINDRLSLGFKIEYTGDLAFRTNDTRNSQTALNTHLVGSLNYKITESQTISLGGEHIRVKSEPNLSDKFQHFSSDLRYNRYLNGGLGSYFKGVNYRVQQVGQSGGAVLQWLSQGRYSSYTAIYKFNMGDDYIDNRNITDINRENKFLRYGFKQHYGRVSTLNRISNSFLTTKVDFSYLDGKGKILNEADNAYAENYYASIIESDLKMTLYRPLSFFRRVNLLVNYINESRYDANYAYSFDYSNLFGELNGEFLYNFSKFRAGLMIGAAYGKNLTYAHDPGQASSNIYVSWVADPLMSYLAADYIEIPAYIRFDIPAKSSHWEILLTGKHQYPIKINYPTGAQFDLKDRFLSYSLAVRLYF